MWVIEIFGGCISTIRIVGRLNNVFFVAVYGEWTLRSNRVKLRAGRSIKCQEIIARHSVTAPEIAICSKVERRGNKDMVACCIGHA